MHTAFAKKIAACVTGIVLSGLLAGAFAQQQVIPIWQGVAPGSEAWTQEEVQYLNSVKERMVRNVVRPTLTAFLPDRQNANGTAMVVCPGGAFLFLAWQSEGTEVAKWLAAHGVAAFVLKYRVLPTPFSDEEFQKTITELFAKGHEQGAVSGEEMVKVIDPLNLRSLSIADARQAMKVVRQHAAEWGIAPNRIGIMGFSAGGMITTGVVLEHDPESRPNFAAPIYGGSLNGRAIPPDAPPLFLLVADDDRLMSVDTAKLYSDWHAAGLSAELHVFSKGGHGFGMTKHGLPVDHWIDLLGNWLDVQGLLKPSK